MWALSHRDARAAYAGLLKNPEVAPLTRRQIKAIKEYAEAVLGSSLFYPWLAVYAAYRGEFLEGWIPDDYFGRVVLPRLNGNHRALPAIRSLSRRLFDSDLFPDLLHRVNGAWYSVEGERITLETAHALAFSEGDSVFMKAESSSQGRAITILRHGDFLDAVLALDGNVVIQRAIEQHAWYAAIFEPAVATVRVLTVSSAEGTPRKRMVYLRVGRGDAQFVTAAEGLKVPVDDLGMIGPFASSDGWQRYRRHPDTGFVFDARQRLPFFDQAVAACERLHARLPQVGVIGWDVAIAAEGRIEIMEWNAFHPGIKFTEAAVGPSFRGLAWEDLR